jgi:hypothetical protein
MNVQLKYIFECADGFKFVRDTPAEIIEIMSDNYQALRKMMRSDDDYCNCLLDSSNKYFPSGSISACLHGVRNYYTLRTEVKEL